MDEQGDHSACVLLDHVNTWSVALEADRPCKLTPCSMSTDHFCNFKTF